MTGSLCGGRSSGCVFGWLTQSAGGVGEGWRAVGRTDRRPAPGGTARRARQARDARLFDWPPSPAASTVNAGAVSSSSGAPRFQCSNDARVNVLRFPLLFLLALYTGCRDDVILLFCENYNAIFSTFFFST